MTAKQRMETMMKDFGPCRCSGVCEVEAEKHGIQVPPREEW